jgi:DUF4097 and DUF4098 domain-containing protein YvlB
MSHLQVRRVSPAAVCALFLGVIAAGCDISVGDGGFSLGLATGKATDEWTRTYTIAPGGSFQIENDNGVVEASPADGTNVEVRAERIVKASSDEAAQELLKSLELREEISPTRVRIVTTRPGRRSSHEVRYHVKVPKGIAVQFETVNGGVRLHDLAGQVTASTTNGGVVGRGLSGPVKARTTNGGLRIEMASLSGEVELETVNGGIRLQLPADARANLEASVTNGGIAMTDLPFQGEQSRRRVSGTVNGGGTRVVAGTVNGGIKISAGSRAESH